MKKPRKKALAYEEKIEKIIKSSYRFEDAVSCSSCPIKDICNRLSDESVFMEDPCVFSFLVSAALGKIDINGNLITPTTKKTNEKAQRKNTKNVAKNHKTRWTKWMKPGQLVLYNGKICSISSVNHDKSWIDLEYEEKNTSFSSTSLPLPSAYSIKPIRLRPYSYEEATKLLGKVMEYHGREDIKSSTLIYDVSKPKDESKTVRINDLSFEMWTNCKATIDGKPIGVVEELDAPKPETP